MRPCLKIVAEKASEVVEHPINVGRTVIVSFRPLRTPSRLDLRLQMMHYQCIGLIQVLVAPFKARLYPDWHWCARPLLKDLLPRGVERTDGNTPNAPVAPSSRMPLVQNVPYLTI